MDKIWDRKSFEVGGHWPLWGGWKKRMTTQNRQKSNAKKEEEEENNYETSYAIYKSLSLAPMLRLGGPFILENGEPGGSQPAISHANTRYSGRSGEIKLLL